MLIGLSANLHSQDTLPKFGPPLDIPLYLSGNFAELRGNHFHTGIDIKTQGVEGQKVLAAENGVISRISVSPWGYGNALYIEHPNGYTTVYGHMQSFSDKITKALREEQYKEEAFRVDFAPNTEIEVTKGEVIGLSGNSGGSGGAHLHFEIRNTATSRPQNPLLFGFDVKDNVKPRMRGVRVHPLGDQSFVNGEQKPKSFVLTGANGKYRLKAGTKIAVYGPFGLSLHTNDYLNDQPNKCGIYSLNLTVDGQEICYQSFDELDFSTSRHINSYKDYEAYHVNGWHYHKSYREPGNLLEVYQQINLEGVMEFSSDTTHEAHFTATDAYGNTSELAFEFNSLSEMPGEPEVETYDAYFAWNMANSYEYEDEMHVDIPKGALYDNLKFQFGREVQTGKSLTPYYSIQARYTPLQKPIDILIVFDSALVENPKQVIAVRESPTGGKSYITGEYKNGGYSFSSKSFGRFYLALDTIAPSLRAYKWSTGGKLNANSKLQFKAYDDKTGFGSYNAYLNGKWTLLQYDPKNQRLWLMAGESGFSEGLNTLKIVVIDSCGNKTEESFTYTY